MIKFYKTANKMAVSRILSDTISQRLNQGPVLWLVAGGSAVSIAVEVSNMLRNSANLLKLTVSLTDERFGPAGHPDSNWKQLIESGFNLSKAKLLPILKNESLEQTVKSYTKMLKTEIASSQYCIALAGLGADGHIFGIMPHSQAVISQNLVEGYKWQDYTRLTPTVLLIKQLDEIIINAASAEKHAQLDRMEQEVSAKDQPAQLLKLAKKVSIYNDYKGEKL